MDNLNGLILAGGQSKRAGTDKGLKEKDGFYWVNTVYKKLEQLGLKTKVSINDSQLQNYSRLFCKEQLIIDDFKIEGPLKGLLSAFEKYPQNNWLILACDMIDMDLATISDTIKAFKKQPNYDFYAHKNSNFYEPFCGIYTHKGLQKVVLNFNKNGIVKNSFQTVLAQSNTLELPISNLNAFKNYNS